ncbi:methyl-accepting chemotaxis protein [Synechococcales cyanobacterium C]|uniref:Methyl-accepting chemotaxis protein n=1 Tax=Petrachloros mirabilis ULC683 TaxID=2781853 RepID=A0A8K2A6U4_9CYAN|nr:methyl-accepting chemotaxis protein [Petrachloros mirabilis]NCJ06201.1 methyl-accepting chemotaxis protein [Petrachloros mirabilis ULC683]
MNSIQSSRSMPLSTPDAPTLAARLQQFVRENLVGTISVTIAGSLILFGGSMWNTWNVYRGFRTTVTRQFEMQKLSGKIVHLDEVLTMSARMAASTGDLAWEERYNQFEPQLDQAIQQTLNGVTDAIRVEASQTDTANQLLIEYETQAFELVRNGQADAALNLLLGADYTEQKDIYSQGINRVLEQVEVLIAQQLQAYRQQLQVSIGFAAATFPILLGAWILVLSAVRDYIRDRKTAQDSLQQSQQNLMGLNTQLQHEIETRKHQEDQVREEGEQLLEDVDHILDVVCSIEQGDLTTQAIVNERATGLVGDTLNRLIEELARIVCQVSTTSQQVSTSSKQQRTIAAAVAKDTDQQVNAVDQVLQLTDRVRQFAHSAAQQLDHTNHSLQELQAAVANGQLEVNTLDQEISVLQQGSDRIVQRMKTLGEFVGLADQFVHNQGDIAEQTQMLALNASLVAARAAEQRDPQQFAAVAQEFASIANQVSHLAQQTNEGLALLEQRNNQIHRVVSDVDTDVQRLGGLVGGFTQGVKQTREIFQTVQAVTGDAMAAGETVTATSQEIVQTAAETAGAMQAIAQLSSQIAGQAQEARFLADTMTQLSDHLLQKVQVFQLPSGFTDTLTTLQLNAPKAHPGKNFTLPALAVEV